MPFTQEQRNKAAPFALYVGAAEALLAQAEQADRVPPPLDGTTLEVCWETLWQFRADDDLDWVQDLRNIFGLGQNIFFYGLLLRCTDPLPDIGYQKGDLLAVIRGTGTTEEWVLNFCAFLKNGTTSTQHPAGLVHEGFYSIYESMCAWDLTGKNVGHAAPALASLLSANGPKLTIAGHSLGSAISSYLVYDVASVVRAADGADTAARLGKLDCYMFASPNPGDDDYAKGLKAAVPSYTVIDWTKDIVPKVPPLPYVPLLDGGAGQTAQNFVMLTPAMVEWQPVDNPGCNHSLASYARMLNPLNPVAQAETVQNGCDPIPPLPAAPIPPPAVPAAGQPPE